MGNLLIRITVALLIVSGLNGCGMRFLAGKPVLSNQPVYTYKEPTFSLKLDNPEISSEEKKILFKRFLKNNNLKPCIKERFSIKIVGEKKVVSNNAICFPVAYQSVISKNNSRAGLYSSYGFETSTYPIYSETFQSKFSEIKTIIEQKFPDVISQYAIFLQDEYPRIQDNLAKVRELRAIEASKVSEKMRKVPITIYDFLAALPLNIEKQYINNVSITQSATPLSPAIVPPAIGPAEPAIWLPNSPSKVWYFLEPYRVAELERLQSDQSLIQEQFSVTVTMKNDYVSRFHIIFEETQYSFPYIDAPDRIKFKIVRIEHSFIPNTFLSSNKTMSANLNQTTLNLKNKSREYMGVNKISIYYNGNVYTRDVNLRIPPESQISYNLKSFEAFTNPYVLVKDRIQKVNFGYAINYTHSISNKTVTLYNTEKYSIHSLIDK